MKEEQGNNTNIFAALELVGYYWKKVRWFIPVSLLIGVLIGGFLYYKKSKEVVQYYGKSTFMMSSDDMGSGGGLSASLGIMLPGSEGVGNKIILLELLKSHKMMEKTLLSEGLVEGDTDLLVNHFIRISGYREKWKGDKKWQNYSYPKNFKYDSSELRDGFLRSAAKQMSLNYTPEKTDAGIFEISFLHPNQDFAKAFLDNLVVAIIDYYTTKKTAKARVVYEYAKKRHDNLYGRMNGQTRSLARMQDRTSEFVFMEDKVPQIRANRDIEATSTMLQEAAKSLAASRMALVQRTPFIQVIDDVRLPLAKIEPKKEKFGIIGLLGGFLGSLILIVGIIVGLDFLKKQKAEYKEIKQTA